MKQLKRVRERIKHRRYVELAIERFVAETLYIAEEEAENQETKLGKRLSGFSRKLTVDHGCQ